jgi:hypothetical protein
MLKETLDTFRRQGHGDAADELKQKYLTRMWNVSGRREPFPTSARIRGLGLAYVHYLGGEGPFRSEVTQGEIWKGLMEGKNRSGEVYMEMPNVYKTPAGLPIDEWGRVLQVEVVMPRGRLIEIRSWGSDGKPNTKDDIAHHFGD